MKNKELEIIKTASLLFSQEGIRKTSVDSISQHCGISKKTFYQYFPDKETIIRDIVTNALSKIDNYIKVLLDASGDVVPELIDFLKFIQCNISVFTPIFISDLLKHYPNVNEVLLEYRRTKFLPFFMQNIDRGILEGCYRESTDSKLIGELYFKQIDLTLEDDSISDSEKDNKLAHINSFFLHGILSGAGAQILYSTLTEKNCNN
jgi:AcrR family transcriptional regulator